MTFIAGILVFRFEEGHKYNYILALKKQEQKENEILSKY